MPGDQAVIQGDDRKRAVRPQAELFEEIDDFLGQQGQENVAVETVAPQQRTGDAELVFLCNLALARRVEKQCILWGGLKELEMIQSRYADVLPTCPLSVEDNPAIAVGDAYDAGVLIGMQGSRRVDEAAQVFAHTVQQVEGADGAQVTVGGIQQFGGSIHQGQHGPLAFDLSGVEPLMTQPDIALPGKGDEADDRDHRGGDHDQGPPVGPREFDFSINHHHAAPSCARSHPA